MVGVRVALDARLEFEVAGRHGERMRRDGRPFGDRRARIGGFLGRQQSGHGERQTDPPGVRMTLGGGIHVC